MKFKYVLSGLVIALVIGGIGWLYATGTNKATAATASPSPTSAANSDGTTNTAAATKSYTTPEVSQHASASSCWMIIDSKVYDVTKFIPEHPGGSQILQGCGTDATSLFNGDTSSHDHSGSARSQLKSYFIGDLKS